ncbi:hypothetical protein L2744_17460 [Shewanella profunda]|uniref:hypothetical protein n=1 Tax=Shewanella profunda TaxID=254793 RepID=UPI00200D3985|nr:hypothetical protein [Shewanella profunda]MCL1091357.1 hypothetical protein [Shewanella profunda]
MSLMVAMGVLKIPKYHLAITGLGISLQLHKLPADQYYLGSIIETLVLSLFG